MDDSVRNYEMPIGKRQGFTLAEIGSDEEGLKYLDYLADQKYMQKWPETLTKIKAYLKDPDVARRLDEALGDD
jgi:hypothetical protein